jgi:hypothetical protein
MLLFVICITGQGELRFVVHVCLIISTVLNFNKCASDGIVMLTYCACVCALTCSVSTVEVTCTGLEQ